MLKFWLIASSIQHYGNELSDSNRSKFDAKYFQGVHFHLILGKSGNLEEKQETLSETKYKMTSHPTKHFLGSTFQMTNLGLALRVGVKVRVTLGD